MERQSYANTQRTNFNRKGRFDLHAYQNAQVRAPGDDSGDFRVMGPATNYGDTASRGGAQGTERGTGFEDTIIQFDSVYADPESVPATGELLWLISPLNGNRDIINCMAVSITPFRFPNIWQTSAGPENGVPILANSRLYIRILGLPFTQAALGFGDLQYHFECAIEDVTDLTVLLVPLRETFFLRRPISSLTELRVRFFLIPTTSLSPAYVPIRLPEYAAKVRVGLPSGNPIFFGIENPPLVDNLNEPFFRPTSIIGPAFGLFLPTPVPVQIRGIVTNLPITDTLINRPEGHFITALAGFAGFNVATIDGTGILTSSLGTAYIQKNRILMPMRFTMVADGPTNYIAVNHQ